MGALRLQRVEEVLARELVAEERELERPALPFRMKSEFGRGQDELVDGGAEGVLGGVDLFGTRVQALGVALDAAAYRRSVEFWSRNANWR